LDVAQILLHPYPFLYEILFVRLNSLVTLRDFFCYEQEPVIDGCLMVDQQDSADQRLALARLKQEHADFDAAINAMEAMVCDKLQVQRMKKKKLAIKDMIARISGDLLPDIIA
jgi:hypothetical protein